MPESVVVLKKENQALKAQVESLSQAMQKLQEKFDQMQPIPSAGLVNADSSTIRENTKSLEFLSKGYDELIQFQAKATAELKQGRSRLDELIVKIDAIGQAVDEIEEYSYKFNLKVVGLPEIKEKESAEETSSLCVKLFREMGARVPTREAHGGPKPIVCKFVRRLARNKVINLRNESHNLRPASLGLAESINLSNVRIFDHLTPRMQSIFYEAKRFKTQHQYQFCWTKNFSVYLRKNAESRAVKIKHIDDLRQLSGET
ncbi:uncharacterized protein [Montipora foliosa]|uniref:uncharacterized protein n=1 Tax=Montipora foliosa TaxID=591990 RepID=UPI0035F215B1